MMCSIYIDPGYNQGQTQYSGYTQSYHPLQTNGADPCINGTAPCINGTAPCINGTAPCINGSGPATVRMVSNNGPPMPMPMQVPPGHMVQQIVDENGILTHVILSPQPPGMPGAPMTTGGPNNSAQQMYPSYSPYTPYTTPSYPPHPHPHPAGPPHMHGVPPPPPPPHLHTGTPPPGAQPHQCNSHGHTPHIHTTQGPPPQQPHHNPHIHMDERTIKQKHKLQKVLERRQREGHYNSSGSHTQPASPRRHPNKVVNGDSRRQEPNSSSSSADGQEIEEERRAIRELLSKMQSPEITDVESRSALIHLIPPDCNPKEFEIYPTEFTYELNLSDKGRDGKYKLVYSGDATVITLKDLKPATEYHLRVCSILDDLKGDLTEPVSFKTQCCEPDQPQPPKLSNRTKVSLLLKWNATTDNGAKITSYSLEWDQGRGEKFTEIFNGSQRQFKVTKLTASTGYTFRLAALNSVGKSEFSDHVSFYTSGSAPSQPDPPMLSEQFVKALVISWIKRPNDDLFTLQMEDEATGFGFLNIYNGSDLSYKIKNLRRNTEYKFRMSANNEEGSSKWSDVVRYRTLPDRPGPPSKPQLKGKVHATSFRVVWDCPKDTGGSDVTSYKLEIDDGQGFDLVYDGADREFNCDHLQPGSCYQVRVSCQSKGGHSDWSESLVVTTQSVAPGPCQAPKLKGKPKATFLHLQWAFPEYDGGAQVTEFQVQMSLPDNTTRDVYRGQEVDALVGSLSPGRPYLFQVKAFNKSGAGPWSEPLEVVSGAGVPDPPKTPEVHCRSPQSAVISWEEPVNNGATVTDYRLEWQQRSDQEFIQLYFGPVLTYEVKNLTPATQYSFRVQALNSAGAGPFSDISTCITPASSPGPVLSVRGSATANSIHLTWKEPNTNGSDIRSYNIDLGEKHLITVENVQEYVIEDLLPETQYRVRVQAVNDIGVGTFSSPIKVQTRALPPRPPRLECVSMGPNSLKLKWGEGKNPDLLQYVLEMLRDNGSFLPVYQGSAQSHKVNKLNEVTEYKFRIYAINEAGEGPYSEDFTFKTTKAPPPAVKAPKVSEVEQDSCKIEWLPLKPLGKDTIDYVLQVQNVNCGDQEYKQMYKGPDTVYKLTELSMKTDYMVRVCAIRLCSDDAGELSGAFSPGVSFTTTSPKPTAQPVTNSVINKMPEAKQLTDQQWAIIILFGFAIIAVLIAFLAQQILSYT